MTHSNYERSVFAMTFGLALALAGCSDSSSSNAPTPATDAGAKDGGADAVAPIAIPVEPSCAAGEPTSCCYASKKYGGFVGADRACGPNQNEDCCAYDSIPGGTFNRGNDPQFPATLPDFKLGRFLVTTSRFKVWMEEGGGLQRRAPAPGAGAHPTIANSGWRAEWNERLSKTVEELNRKVYTTDGAEGFGCTLGVAGGERWPVNCVDWFQMQAFCAWDGGYAITEAMWEYAARGGSEQRKYAWGNDPSTDLETQVACLEGGGEWGVDLWCNNPSPTVPKDVGFAKKGKGRWGTYDLMGNLINLTRDESGDAGDDIAPFPMPCANDCVTTFSTPTRRVFARGTSFSLPNNLAPDTHTDIAIKRVGTMRKDFNGEFFGFRCAYPTNWPESK